GGQLAARAGLYRVRRRRPLQHQQMALRSERDEYFQPPLCDRLPERVCVLLRQPAHGIGDGALRLVSAATIGSFEERKTSMNARVAFEELVLTADGFALSAWPRDAAPVQLLPAFAEIFCRDAKRQQVSLTLPFEHDDDATHAFVTRAIREGIVDTAAHEGSMLRLTKAGATVWQQACVWLTAPSSAGRPMRYTIHHNRRHPVRA